MCNHQFIKYNDVTVCLKCGLTSCLGQKIIFDKKLHSELRKRGKKKCRKKTR